MVLATIFIGASNGADHLSYEDLPGIIKRLAKVSQDFKLNTQLSLSYDDARKELYGTIQNVAGGDASIYLDAEKDVKETINCEHVVPQSRFNKKLPMRSDLHHLYPAYEPLNELRANFKYDDIPNSKATFIYFMDKASNAKYTNKVDQKDAVCEVDQKGQEFEPNGISKGNVARSCAYFFTRYPQYLPEMYKVIDIDTMIKWHESDPVNDVERRRNQAIYKIQGANNPYIVKSKDFMRQVWLGAKKK